MIYMEEKTDGASTNGNEAIETPALCTGCAIHAVSFVALAIVTSDQKKPGKCKCEHKAAKLIG